MCAGQARLSVESRGKRLWAMSHQPTALPMPVRGAARYDPTAMAVRSKDHLEQSFKWGSLGRWRRAGREAALALKDDPDDPLALGLQVRAQAETGEITFQEGERRVREIAAAHPEAPRAAAQAALLRFRGGDRAGAQDELRTLSSANPSIPAIHASLASRLAKEHPDEAWEQYLTAFQQMGGSFASPAQRAGALSVAYRTGRGRAARALILPSVGRLERWVLVSRVVMFTAWRGLMMPLFFAVPVVAGLLAGAASDAVAAAIALGVILGAAWESLCLLYPCWAKQCIRSSVALFVLEVAMFWATFAIGRVWGRGDPAFVVGVILAFAVIEVMDYGRKTKRRERWASSF